MVATFASIVFFVLFFVLLLPKAVCVILHSLCECSCTEQEVSSFVVRVKIWKKYLKKKRKNVCKLSCFSPTIPIHISFITFCQTTWAASLRGSPVDWFWLTGRSIYIHKLIDTTCMEINDLCHRVQFPARDGEVQGLFCFVCGKKVAWTRAMAVTDGRVSPSKTTSGQIRAASYLRSTARQRTFTVQVFVVSLRMKSNHGSYFFGRWAFANSSF